MTNKISTEIKERAKQVILAILSAKEKGQKSISVIALLRLVALTSRLTAPTFIRLHNYVSDESQNCEAQDVTVILGAKYGKARAESIKKAEDLTAEDITAIQSTCTPDQIKGFKYINKKGISAEAYCKAVAEAVPEALAKKLAPKTRNNDGIIRINSSLQYFINTNNLILFGQKVKDSKKVNTRFCPTCGGTYEFANVVEDSHTACPICNAFIEKLTANKPMTIAGNQIDKYLNSRASKISRFSVANAESISILGESLDLVPIEEEEEA
jgi:hypothetical protein